MDNVFNPDLNFNLGCPQPQTVAKDTASPTTKPSVETVPVDEFERRWKAFTTTASYSTTENATYKALARLGYSWAVRYFESIAREAYPK